ncbi:MAG: hypothetical protein ACTSYB_00125 [Candidatus Helarchaeota archaeon]
MGKKFYVVFCSIIIISTLVIFVVIPLVARFDPMYGIPTLEFPVQDPNNVTRLSGYNHPDWGEPGLYHNGIDLVCKNYTYIVSPVNGIIISITENQNPYKNFIMFHVTILVNYFWNVKIVFEPNLNSSEGNAFQRSLIAVQLFQRVSVGEVVGILLNGSSDYPHIHLMLSRTFRGTVCPYEYSSDTAKIYYEQISNVTGETICYPGPSAADDLYDLLAYIIVTGAICIIVIVLYEVRKRKKSKID